MWEKHQSYWPSLTRACLLAAPGTDIITLWILTFMSVKISRVHINDPLIRIRLKINCPSSVLICIYIKNLHNVKPWYQIKTHFTVQQHNEPGHPIPAWTCLTHESTVNVSHSYPDLVAFSIFSLLFSVEGTFGVCVMPKKSRGSNWMAQLTTAHD